MATAEKGGATGFLRSAAQLAALLVAGLAGPVPAGLLRAQPAPHDPRTELLTRYNPAVARVLAAQSGAARAHFNLVVPAEIRAGDKLRVEIRRQSHDGRRNGFELWIGPASLLASAPAQPVVIAIEDAADGWSGEFAIVDNPPAGVAPRLSLALRPFRSEPVIDQAVASVTVLAKPPAAPDGGASSNQTGTETSEAVATGSSELSNQANIASPSTGTGNEAANEAGGGGKASAPEAKGGTGQEGGGPGADWREQALQWGPVALALVLVGLLWWLARPPPAPAPDAAPRDGGRQPAPGGEVHGECIVKFGDTLFPGGEPRLRVPAVERSVEVRMGKASCPVPLPVTEDVDG